MIEYQPKLFIDVGATGAFYTLRETYLHKSFSPGPGSYGNAVVNGVYRGSSRAEERSFHHFNLSQDPAEAFAKACEYASLMGLTLTTKLETLDQQMRDIQRASREELEASKREEEQREREWRESFEGRQKELLKNPEVLEWLNENAEWAEGDVPSNFAAHLLIKVNLWGGLTEGQMKAVLRIIEADKLRANSVHVGEVGERIEVAIKVDKVMDWSYGSYPTIVRIANLCRTLDGNVIKYVGNQALKNGVYKFTVKAHDEYRDEKQTVVQRPKFIREIEENC